MRLPCYSWVVLYIVFFFCLFIWMPEISMRLKTNNSTSILGQMIQWYIFTKGQCQIKIHFWIVYDYVTLKAGAENREINPFGFWLRTRSVTNLKWPKFAHNISSWLLFQQKEKPCKRLKIRCCQCIDDFTETLYTMASFDTIWVIFVAPKHLKFSI